MYGGADGIVCVDGLLIDWLILVCMAACLIRLIDRYFVCNVEYVSLVIIMVPLPSLYLLKPVVVRNKKYRVKTRCVSYT